jgi:hypothetical protein
MASKGSTNDDDHCCSFTCVACGGGFDSNPRVARALAGSKGDPATPHLCWVCAHLRASALREAVEIRAAFGE